MEDDAAVKIISRLGVDYSQALLNTKMLATETAALDKQLKMLKVTAVNLGHVGGAGMMQQLDQYGNVLSSVTGKTETFGKVTESRLAAIEKRLVATAAAAQKMGVSIPGIEGKIGEISGYRDALQQQQSLTKEQLKSVAAIGDYSAIQSNNVATLQKEIELQARRVQGEEMLGDAASRRQAAQLRGEQAINRQWDEYLAKQAIADEKLKQQQTKAAWGAYGKESETAAKQSAAKAASEVASYEAMLKQKESATTLLPTIEAQVALAQKKLTTQGIDNKQLQEQGVLLRGQIALLQNRLAAEGKLTAAEIAQTNELKKQALLLEKNVSVAAYDSATKVTKTATAAAKEHSKTVKDVAAQYSVLESQMERRAGWFIAGSAFFGSIAAAGAATKTITDVEMGMTEIARITEDATFNFQGMRDELLALGLQYGMTWNEAHDIALRFAQAGYSVKDILKLTESAFLALNTAELNAEQSTIGFIAILAQWGMTAEQLLPTLDKINKVADSYAITSQDLVDGLVRSSGAANVLGLSLNETIAILTVMREATGRTGREVGNALNSILSFMQRDVALSAFAREGIAVWADEAQTQFRNFINIFDEVAARWQSGALTQASMDMFTEAAEQAGLYSEELAELAGAQKEFSDLQQRDISQAMAGIYRRNYLLALLQNWSKVQEVLNSQLDASGYSMRENERTMETLSKQYDQLKVAAQQLAVAIGDAGLLNELKGVVEGTGDAIALFNELDPTLRNLIITFIEVTAATKILSAVVRMAGIESASTWFSGWAISAAKASAASRILTTTTQGLGLALSGVGRGILAFFGGPLGLALTAGITGVVALNNHMKQQAAQSEENAKTARDLTEEYDRLNNQMASAKKDTGEYNTLQNELQGTMNAIADIMPDVVSKWDSMGNAIAFNNDKLRENIVLAKEAAAANLEQSLSVAYRKKQTLSEQMALFEEEQRRIQSGQPPESEWKFRITGKGALIIPDPANVQKIRQELSAVGEEIRQITELMAGGASDVGIGLPKGGGSFYDSGSGYVGSVPGEKAKAAGGAIKGQINTLADAIKQLDLVNRQYEASLAKTSGLLNINAAEYDYLTGKIESGVAVTEDYARAQELVAVKVSLLLQEQNQLHQANDKYRADVGVLTSVLEEAARQYEAFAAASDTEHMDQAAQVVSQLQDKIQSLTSTIDQNSASWWKNQQAIMEVTQATSRDYLNRLTNWMRHYEAIGRLTNEQALSCLNSIDKTGLALQDLWQIEEDIYSRRRRALQDEMDAIKDAYDERLRMIEDEIEAEESATNKTIRSKEAKIKAIEEETSAQIKAIQVLIDALDIEGEQSSREEAEREHNQKLADLQKQRRDHELRTGIAHEKAIADINEQIAEEEHKWELQKQDWARQDQKDAYRDQIDSLKEQSKTRQDAIRDEIDEIKKASDAKKKELQRYYSDVQRLMNDKTVDMLTSLSLYGDKYVAKVEEILGRIRSAIEANQMYLLPGLIDELENVVDESKGDSSMQPPAGSGHGETPAPSASKTAVATFTSGEYINKNDYTYAPARMIAEKLNLSVDWDEVARLVTIGGKKFSPDFIQNDRAYLSLRQVASAFGYDVSYDNNSRVVSYFPRAHIGAYVGKTGVAELLQGERVLSPQLTISFDRLANVLSSIPSIPDRISLMQQQSATGSFTDSQVDRIIAAIEKRKGTKIDRALHIEHFENNDNTDVDILARDLRRTIMNLR